MLRIAAVIAILVGTAGPADGEQYGKEKALGANYERISGEIRALTMANDPAVELVVRYHPGL